MRFRFYILFTNNSIREELDQNDFGRYYGNFFFEKVISKILDHSYVQSSFSSTSSSSIHNYEAPWKRILKDGIWKTPYNWRFYGHGSTWKSSLHQGIWRIIVCLFSLSYTRLDLKFNLVLIEKFSLLFIFLPLDILLSWSSCSTTKHFLEEQ